MKILIVDNGLSEKSKENFNNIILEYRKSEFQNKIIFCDYKNINLENINFFDCIILSGGKNFPVLENTENLKLEYQIFNNFNKPILGICYGFEIIANYFNMNIENLEYKVKETINIKIYNVKDPLTVDLECLDLDVWESHRYCIKKVSDDFIILGDSKYGIEIFKHKDKLIYGTQFHPESLNCGACGKFLIQNFLEIAKYFK